MPTAQRCAFAAVGVKTQNEKASKKRGAYPPSASRFVRCGDWIRTIPWNILLRSSRGRARTSLCGALLSDVQLDSDELLRQLWIFDSLSLPAPNGLRYLRVGGRRQRRFAGTSLQPRKPPENAATPTRRVHAVLGRTFFDTHSCLAQNI